MSHQNQPTRPMHAPGGAPPMPMPHPTDGPGRPPKRHELRQMRQSDGARTGIRATIAVIAGLLVCAFVVLAVNGIISMALTREATSTANLPAAAKSITVKADFADVEVREADTRMPKVTVVSSAAGLRDAPAPKIGGDAQNVTITAPRMQERPWSFGGPGGSQRIIVEVPNGDAGRQFAVETSYGDVSSSVNASGLDISTSAGDVDVSGTVGDTVLKSSMGDIEADGLVAEGRLAAQTDYGTVTLLLSSRVPPKGPIDVTSSNGDITVEVADVGDRNYYRVDARTDMGEETDELAGSLSGGAAKPGEGPVDVALRTSMGDLRIGYAR